VWFIANNVFNVRGFMQLLEGGNLENLPAAIGQLTSTPDFWLWVYIAFTVSNTMMPNFRDLQGWRVILPAVGIALAALFLLGVGDEVLTQALNGPIGTGLSILAGTFAVIIAVDLLMIAILGSIESLVERVTGDSATFQNGKMITMRRDEILKQREQERLKQQKQEQARRTAPAGPPSIYRLPLPIPGAPGKEPVSEPITVRREEPAALPGSEGRAGASMIMGSARPVDTELRRIPVGEDDLPPPDRTDLDEDEDEAQDEESG
jgi:hypothetical protein